MQYNSKNSKAVVQGRMGAHLEPNIKEMLPLKRFLFNVEANFRCKKTNHMYQPLYLAYIL